MTTDLLTILQNFGYAIYDAFVLPGNFLLSKFVANAPIFAAKLGINGDETTTILPVVLSLLSWTLLAVVASIFVNLLRNVTRIAGAIIRTVSFRISLALGNVKTRLVCKLRQLFPKRQRNGLTGIPMVEFDDLDLAVLRQASALGPGFALSAPELAEQFTLRPAQVQRSLEKLSRNKILDYVIGSTDGYDNYRMTDYGAAFLAMYQRQDTKSESPLLALR